MITLSNQFISAYPDSYVDNDFVVTKRCGAVYHPTQRFMVRWDRGFSDPVNDEYELIRYTVYPCDIHEAPNGDQWVSNERTATFSKVLTVAEFNQFSKELQQNGYLLLHVDASTDPSLVTSDKSDAELQSYCDRARFQRSMRANGFA